MSSAARTAPSSQELMTDPLPGLRPAEATRIMLRPIASPLPLGFLALFAGSLLISAVQLHWVPVAQRHELAIGLLALTVPLQLIACLYGFLCRDVVAATGVGVLGGTWAALGVTWLTSPPNTTSPGLGMILVVAAGALLIPTIAALTSKVVAGLVIFSAAARFAATGAYELSSAHIWQYASGICGILVAGLALYTALANRDRQRHPAQPATPASPRTRATSDIGAAGRPNSDSRARSRSSPAALNPTHAQQ